MVLISENRALMILTREGDFTEMQADIVLRHSLKEKHPSGANLYPSEYIFKRARENAARKDED